MTPEIIFYIFVSVLVTSAVSLAGVLFLIVRPALLHSIQAVLISLAVGTLLGDVFFHILPEAAEEIHDPISIAIGILIGFLVFLVLEKIVHYHHFHLHSENKLKPFVYNNLIGDALHNFIDGALITGSYLVSIPLGITTTVAVILHEIPQELGDFGVLVQGGVKPRRALQFNFLSAATAVLGAFLPLVFAPALESAIVWALPFTAGAFIYIAASDLVPELHHALHGPNQTEEEREYPLGAHLLQVFGILLGIILMWLLLYLE